MKVAGFNLTKITAERGEKFKGGKINSNIEILNIEKETFNMLKESDGLKIYFKHTIDYESDEKNTKLPSLLFEGIILMTGESEEIKNKLKEWKKKRIGNDFKLNVYNLILKKCSLKALQLQEELNLPSHVQIPRLTTKTTLET